MNKLFSFLVIILMAISSPLAFAEMGKASINPPPPAVPASPLEGMVKAVSGANKPAPVILGSAKFQETPEGLKITIKFKSAPAGKHGIHIHQYGSCSNAGAAAGDHFNPAGAKHGLVEKDGSANAHAGDLGNIDIGPDGTGTLRVTIPDLGLTSGKYNVAGRSIVLHEKADDLGQPAGNAGNRIGCGRIIITADPAPKPEVKEEEPEEEV